MPSGFDRSTTKILVGLQRIGIIGLYEAFEEVVAAGLLDREAIASRLAEIVARENYVPPEIAAAYRRAVLREFVRYKGESIHELYSELEILVCGVPGEVRDRFVDTLRSVLSEFELTPIVRFASPDSEGPHPKLLIDDETVLAGDLPDHAMRPLIKARLSHW